MSLAFLALLSGCLSVLEVDIASEERYLVVDGGISNLHEPYTIRLNYTTDVIGAANRGREAVSGALVQIEQLGEEAITLREVRSGTYQTDSGNFQGRIGEEYRLHIELRDGTTYESTAQELLPPSDIVGDQIVYNTGFLVAEDNPFIRRRFQEHQVFVDVRNENSPYYYKIETSGIELQRPIPGDDCPTQEVRDFWYGNLSDGTRTLNCWQRRGSLRGSSRLVFNQNFQSDFFTTQVAAVPFDNRAPFVASVQVKTITRDAYDFWQVLFLQNEPRTDLFSPPLASPIGNVYSTTDPNETVLGFFSVEGISIRNVCIERDEEQSFIPIRAVSMGCGQNCLTIFPNSTWEPPPEAEACN